MPIRNSKRLRYEAIFGQAAELLAAGEEVFLRPESEADYRTALNYWYQWRKIHWGTLCKSGDPALRDKAARVLDSKVALDTDNKGRLILRLRPSITPQTGPSVERVVPVGIAAALSTGHGGSVPSAGQATANRYTTHTEPWQAWFETLGGFDLMLEALTVIPREARRDPDLPSIDDLPDPNGSEATAWQGRFKHHLVALGMIKP